MTTPRIPPLDDAEARAAAKAAGIPDSVTVLNINRVLLANPTVARRFVEYFLALMYEGVLDPRLRELAILRIAWRTGSVYEWTQHWLIATGMGISGDDLIAVRDPGASDRFTPAERAILTAVDDVVDTGAIGPDVWADLAAHLPSDADRLEAVAAITGWRMVASILESLEVPLEDGVAPWPPDGQGP